MKATVETIAAAPAADKGRVALVAELTKARLTTLVVLTTLVGFYLGVRGAVDYALMFHTVLGTALLASGAAALNQLLEREHDAKMRRTETRPLPAGRIQPETVLIIGGVVSAAGLIWLAWKVNPLTSVLGAVTLVSYLFLYTPLKRLTTLNTAIGAVPGALPPLMGWTAARGEITIEGWSLFAILFFWQLPHFLAIAWMYREDYARAGFRMLPVVDPEGTRTGMQSVSHTLGLLSVSLFPVWFGLVGTVYLLGALVLGGLFLAAAVRFSRELTTGRARQLFFASIIYLPLLLGLMVFDKVKLPLN
ncbi:MAG: protoheme IX farnesyltransferase [Verrucomicrobia bacterium]|nr:protoheme IX farnesyltransferase [Verrucomicrobiota bacterium]